MRLNNDKYTQQGNRPSGPIWTSLAELEHLSNHMHWFDYPNGSTRLELCSYGPTVDEMIRARCRFCQALLSPAR